MSQNIFLLGYTENQTSSLLISIDGFEDLNKISSPQNGHIFSPSLGYFKTIYFHNLISLTKIKNKNYKNVPKV